MNCIRSAYGERETNSSSRFMLSQMNALMKPHYVADKIRELKAQLARLDAFEKTCTPRQKITARNIREHSLAYLGFYEDLAKFMTEFPDRYGPFPA